MKQILFVLLMIANFANNGIAQQTPKTQVDTLEMLTRKIKANSTISFKAKVASIRSVETMSCSCNKRDFYYQVYKKTLIGWKLYIDHKEKRGKPRCTCKTQKATFINGQQYNIPPIKDKGTYYILIEGYLFKMKSNSFKIVR